MTKKSKAEIREIEHKLAGFDDLFKELEKQYGENTGRPLTHHKVQTVPRIPTGLVKLDRILGGGLPMGRILEVFGPESSGKTTLCLKIMAEAQRQGKVVAFIDVEHALDPIWAAKIGVDLDTMLWDQPMSGEEAMEVTRKMVDTGKVGVIVVDSVAALLPLAEAEGDIGEAHMARQARLMSQSLRILVPIAAKNGCTIIFTNQTRMKLGVMFGNPETTSGGMALRFYSSVRLDIRRSKHTEGEERTGDKVTIKAIKNKVGRPFMTMEIPLIYDEGFDTATELAQLLEESGALEKRGSYYYRDGALVAQGQVQLRQWVTENRAEAEILLETK